MAHDFRVHWYGERGIVNAVIAHIQRAADAILPIKQLLSAVQWADGTSPAWVREVNAASVFVEWGWADFGNPDLLLVLRTADGSRCVLIEAKVGPYMLSMRPNRTGMREPGFNSSINGQLALRYRFAKAVETAKPEALAIEEPAALLQQYRARLGDPRSLPRRLVKSEVVNEMLRKNQLLGISEERWVYVTLTWDAAERAFFRDPFVAKHDGLPCFLSESGDDLLPLMRGRVGWLGYRHLESALGLSEDRDYVDAFDTMEATSEPDGDDYEVAQAKVNGGASPEALALAAKLRRELFAGFDTVTYPGSYSITRDGQTVAKIIPYLESVFVGVRESESPETWFSGPLEPVSINGVTFLGIQVPVESPDAAAAANLTRGLPPRV
jgi:hypothetical protein